MKWRYSPKSSSIEICDEKSKTIRGVGTALGSLTMKLKTGIYYAGFQIQKRGPFSLLVGVGLETKMTNLQNGKKHQLKKPKPKISNEFEFRNQTFKFTQMQKTCDQAIFNVHVSSPDDRGVFLDLECTKNST